MPKKYKLLSFLAIITLIAIAATATIIKQIELTRNESGETTCGNDICEEGEGRFSCKKDCGINPAPYHPEKYKSITYYDSILGRNLTRTYMIHIPPSYENGAAMPLVLNFHGGGGTANTAEIAVGGMNKKSDQEGFIAVYPNGTSSVNEPGKKQAWYAEDTLNISFIKKVDDIGFIRTLLIELKKGYSIDPKRIYVTGISNGAWMTYAVACKLSEEIAAIAPAAGGTALKDCNPENPVSIIHFHGTADPGWPYDGGASCYTDSIRQSASEVISKWRKINSCSPNIKTTYQKGDTTCNTYDSCSKGTEITLCTIEGGGHTYPGGYDFPSEKIIPWDRECALGIGIGVGKSSKDISALDAMWDFFRNHPKK